MTREISYLLICDKVIQEATDGKMSAVGIFDTIEVKEENLPISVHLEILARVKNAKGLTTARVSILKPNGIDEHQFVPFEDNPPTETEELNMRAIFGPVKFEEVGNYKIAVTADGTSIDNDKYYFKINRV